MQSDTALLETSTAAYARLGCREPRVLHAWFFDFPPQKLPFCASRDMTREPFFQQQWQFRVIGAINKLSGTAKTLLHEMDLKVAGLVLSGIAKGLRWHGAERFTTVRLIFKSPNWSNLQRKLQTLLSEDQRVNPETVTV